jgi:hypothetical protein
MVSTTPRLKPAGMRITNSGSPDSSSDASLAPSLFSLNEKTILGLYIARRWLYRFFLRQNTDQTAQSPEEAAAWDRFWQWQF